MIKFSKTSLLLLIGIFLISIPLIMGITKSTGTADAGSLIGTYTHSGGTYVNTQADDTSYYFVGTGNKQTNVDAYIALNFSLSSLGIVEETITGLNFSAIYCHDGSNSVNNVDCDGDSAEGTANGNQNVEVYNHTNSTWFDIGNLLTNDNGNSVQGNFSLSGGFADFVHDNTNDVRVRFQMNWTTGTSNPDDAYLVLDYVTLQTSYNPPPNVTALNNPGDNSYLNNNTIVFNFTAKSAFGFTNATIYGNWSNGWHANTTIFNTTINNGTSSNVTLSGIPDGKYIWNVLVYDNASVVQSDWFGSNYTFVVDTEGPQLNLNAPSNDSINQTSSKIINITVKDNRNEIIVKIYGGNESSFFENNSLLYKGTVINNTEIVYNWTAPVLNVTDKTILLMHFDLEGAENDTFFQDETGRHNGTKLAVNAPVWNESGKFGYALGFDGTDDYASITESLQLDLTGNFSIGLWIYPTDLTRNQTILTKGKNESANYYIDYKTTNKIEFGFYSGGFRSVSVNANNITVRNWSHIVATWNNNTNISRVYINGVDKGSLALNFDILDNDENLSLGYFPGYNQNFSGLIDELVIYNKTLSGTAVSDMYKLKNDEYFWRVVVNDTASNVNISSIREFTLGNIWTVSPTNLGSIGATLNTNVSLGVITINNTRTGRNVTIDISSNYTSGIVYYNLTLPYVLNGSNTANSTGFLYNNSMRKIQINISTSTTEGTQKIVFNVTGNNTDSGGFSIPRNVSVQVILAASASNPLLISEFETAPSVVSQNNTGIELKASVINRGQGNAQNVELRFVLPKGWTNSSGEINKSLGILTINEQKNASINVNINASATAGSVSLYANLSGQNSTGGTLGVNLLTLGSASVTVNAISAGTGPTVTIVTTTPSSSGGGSSSSGSGGGGSAGGGEIVYAKEIEVVRAETVKFEIEVENKFSNATLENLVLSLSGFPEQYVLLEKNEIRRINSLEKGAFVVELNAPSYNDFEEFTLKAVIRGERKVGLVTSSYVETQNIRLIIQEISKEVTENKMEEAGNAITEMEQAGFNIIIANSFLEQGKEKLEERRNKEAYDFASKVVRIKDAAFEVNDLIDNIKTVLKNPKKIRLITGNVPLEIRDENGNILNVNSLITGNAIFDVEEVSDLINLAIAAFERGDYEIALERAQSAQILLILERKGNLGLFLYLYWHFVLIGALTLTIFGLMSYQKYRKGAVSVQIRNNSDEESKVLELITDDQRRYFEGKISVDVHKANEDQYRKRISDLKKNRTKLRNTRIKLLKPLEVLKNLDKELAETYDEIRKLQVIYYKKGKMTEKQYKTQFEGLNERVAEIESERLSTTLIEGHDEGSFVDALSKLVVGKNVKGKWIKINHKKKVKRRGKK